VSLFAQGDLVRANISEQGLTKGQGYRIKEVIRGRMGIVCYDVGLKSLIVNGHFFLDLVSV